MDMYKLREVFHRSCKYEIYCLYISYIINLMIISIFLMMATGVSDVQNVSLSQNDTSQLAAIISSVVLVSILTIVFFQWVINTQIRALYNRRSQFNINIRLIGMDKNALNSLYLWELLRMQLVVVPVGVVFSEIVYKILAVLLELKENVIPMTQLLLAIGIHFLVIVISEVVTIAKMTGKGIAEQLRKTTDMESVPGKGKMILFFWIGAFLLLVSIFLEKNAEMRQIAWLSKLIIYGSFFFFYDSIVYVFHKILCRGAESLKAYQLLLAQKISYGYFKRVKIICMMFIFSTTLFLGLQMLYKSVREAGYHVVQNNILYEGSVSWEEMQEQRTDVKDVFWGLRFHTKTDSGTNIYVSGINPLFINEYEHINPVNLSQDNLQYFLSDSNSNGIILPEFFITDDDIGQDISVEIEGKQVTFEILDGYYSNNFSKLNCYVNYEYLKEQLNLGEEYNIAYLKDGISSTDVLQGSGGHYQSKEEIAEESVKKAVGGTEVIEMITVIIIACAIISLINFFVMTASANKGDIIRFRALGISSDSILGIYIIHSLLPILFSVLWILPFSSLFCKIACNIMLASEYFADGYASVPGLTIFIILLVTVVSLVTEIICVWKSVYRKEFIAFSRSGDNQI